MAKITYSSLSSYAAVILLVLDKHGYDLEKFKEFSGTNLEQLIKENERLESNMIAKMWDKAAEFSNDPEIGIKAIEFFQPAAWKTLGFSLLCSKDIRDALQRTVKYCSVLTDSLTFGIVETDKNITFTLTPALGFHYSDVQLDYGLGCMVQILRSIVPWDLKLTQMDMMRPAPENPDTYYKYYGHKINFNCDSNRYHIELSQADIALPLHDQDALDMLERVLESYMVKRGQSNFARSVSEIIIKQLPGKAPTESEVAELLNFSKRNMQRKLKDVNLTFNTLLTDIRTQLAEEYLRDLSLSLTEVGYLLGFSDQSTFTRAFGGWYGITPKRYRDEGRATP